MKSFLINIINLKNNIFKNKRLEEQVEEFKYLETINVKLEKENHLIQAKYRSLVEECQEVTNNNKKQLDQIIILETNAERLGF